jgi:hypothetical protein
MEQQLDVFARLMAFLGRLEAARIWYRLSKIRDAVMVEVAVPGQRWEVEFFVDGHIEREIFESTNYVEDVADLSALEALVEEWAALDRAQPPDA